MREHVAGDMKCRIGAKDALKGVTEMTYCLVAVRRHGVAMVGAG